MKQLFILLFFISVISCKKQSGGADSVMLAQNAGWTAIDFKTDYTIQLPSNYVGPGMQGFEGNTFSKESDDNSVAFSYNYCSPLFCSDFGDTLSQPFSNTINIKVNDSAVTLNQNVSFVDDNSLQAAILYYNNENNNSHARLYWKDGGVFKQALEVTFDYARLQEVLDIVKTIKEK